MADEADNLNGYEEIASFLRWPLPTVKRRALDGVIPTFKAGRTVCARKSSLLAWMADQEARAAKGRDAA